MTEKNAERQSFPLDQYSWEIPQGGGGLDLDPLQSAARELQEETGLVAGLLDLPNVCAFSL